MIGYFLCSFWVWLASCFKLHYISRRFSPKCSVNNFCDYLRCSARRSNQSILKEISPGISLEGMMLKLKLQYFGHLMWRVDSLEKTDAGRDWGQEEKGMTENKMAGLASLTRWTWIWVNSGSWWWTGRPGVLWFMGSQRVRHDWATELNWTEGALTQHPGLRH